MVRFTPPPKRSGLAWWLPLLVVLALVLVTWLISHGSSPAGTATSGTRSSTPATAGPAPQASPSSGLATIPESKLPTQAKDTLALIRSDGPFPYRADGATFQNREGILPAQPRGYYREYTVRTPGSADRGPRRLIAGAGHDIYWTTDHYASFRQVLEGR